MLSKEHLLIVRPNLGNPLLLKPSQLSRFEIAIAHRIADGSDEEPFPGTTAVLNLLRQDPPTLWWQNKSFPLQIHGVSGYFQHPHYKDDYATSTFAESSPEQQYCVGYRWEVKVEVGLSETQINDLQEAFGWPTLLNLNFNKTKFHCLYIHETLTGSNEFTILHITDTHIAQRNDLMPEILCQVRNKNESQSLSEKYVNFNDNLRSFIRLVNSRVLSGEKLIVVLTGDVVDHYFDGWWDGKFILGQGQFAPNRVKEAPESEGSGWHYSNVSKFIEIITGADHKSDALKSPIYIILGNHDYLPNEPLLCMTFYINLLISRPSFHKNNQSSFGLSADEGREYDYWAFPRVHGQHPSIIGRKFLKEAAKKQDWRAELNQDWAYWLAKPKQWILSQFITEVNYDLDFTLNIGSHQMLFFNTGHDRYPGQERFAKPKEDFERDYIEDGPHSRGITNRHVDWVKTALVNPRKNGLLLIFTHAPLIGLQGDVTEGIEVLYEDSHEKSPHGANQVSQFLSDHYNQTQAELIRSGFTLFGARHFALGSRDPYLNFSCADGAIYDFLKTISRKHDEQTTMPILVFSGHTHKVHEFRIERLNMPVVRDIFRFFSDNYSRRLFSYNNSDLASIVRALYLQTHSPLLFTSGAVKNKKPQFREIMIKEQSLISLDMKEVPESLLTCTGNFQPGCRLVAFNALDGGHVSLGGSERNLVHGGKGESQSTAFEIVQLESQKIAIKTYDGYFVRVKEGSMLVADVEPSPKNLISLPGGAYLAGSKPPELFELRDLGHGKIALSTSKGKFVSIEKGENRRLVANKDQATDQETFELVSLEP